MIVFIVWASVPPSNDREWRGEYARMPHARYEGNTLTVFDIRDFEYHGSLDDYVPRYHTITYNLKDLQGVDLVLSYWDDKVMIAHSMLVFRFKNKRNFVVSAETRREKGEPWDIPRGFFNQYELIYVLATEEDVIGRRINISNEDVFLYPTKADNESAGEILKNVVDEINSLHAKPRFYNTLVENCTSSLFTVARRPELFDWFNPELLLNGVSDRYLRRAGLIEGGGTYWEFKYKHYINPLVRGAEKGADFSKVIRHSAF